MEGSESWPYVQVPLWESKTLCNQRTVRKLKKKKKRLLPRDSTLYNNMRSGLNQMNSNLLFANFQAENI